MAILPLKKSIKNKPTHNFSQKISHPSSSLIVCSSDFIEFISSLWGLGILLRYYPKPMIVLADKKGEFYINNLYPERDFSCITFPELMLNNDIKNIELVVILTNTLQKDAKAAFKKIPNAVIAGTSTFSDIHVLNCIISVNDLQSYYYLFFSFASQLTGIMEDWDDYTGHFTFITDNGHMPEKKGVICIDISSGIYDTRFKKRHIYGLVNGLQKSFPIEILFIDRDRTYYEKLSHKKFNTKPELLVINDYSQAHELLKSAKLLIAPNTPLMHCMQYTHLPTFCIMTPHERRFLSRSPQNRIHVTQRFSELKIKNILPLIEGFLK